VLYKVADAFQRMHDPARRAALIQQLFGKSGIALLPILMRGREGVRKLLEEQKRAGNYISGKGMKSAKSLIVQQRELETALAGVKVQLGQALLPVLVQVMGLFTGFLRVLQPLTKNATLFKIAIAALAVAFVAYKIAMIAATIATDVFEASAAPAALIAAAVVVAIAALAVGVYELWKHVRLFREGVRAAWSTAKTAFAAILDAAKALWQWVKTNWPYLVGALAGPWGIAAVAIIKHFGQIKQFVLGVVRAVRQAIENLVSYVESLPDKVGGTLKKIPGVGAAAGVASTVGGAAASVFRQHGGPVQAGGIALVGERGPELVRARTALSVQPVALAPLAPDERPGRRLEIVVPVVVDGREIARAVARVGADQLARA
jgi:hypothetical protein